MTEADPPQDHTADPPRSAPESKSAGGESTAFVDPEQGPTRDSGHHRPGTIGKYRLKREIAKGGMGTIYEAVQHQPHRVVALKVMRLGVTSRSALRRFEYESQLLARLRHPGIAQVFEAGTHEDFAGPVPYFAMEYIPNAKPITQYARDKKLSVREKLELFVQVCDAVHHGHSKGIIHRDLKPGNILVDAHGKVKIIDFGVARATDSDMAATTVQTAVGELVGTLRYMSPEQYAADPSILDARSDVYALGVVLYELLTGELPCDLGSAGAFDVPRLVREETPRALRTFDKTLRGELETVVGKALEKERERRYQSAHAFGDDIARYLRNDPIVAVPPSVWYGVRLFARRNRLAFAVGVTVFFILLAATLVSLSLYQRAERARQEAVIDRDRAVAAEKIAQQQRSEARRQGELARAAQGLAEQQEQLARRNLYTAQIALAQQAWERADMSQVLELLNQQRPAPGEQDFRGFEWYYLWSLCHSDLRTIDAHTRQVRSVAFSPDGKTLASTSERSVKLWDVASGKERLELTGHTSWAHSAAFSPDGKILATAGQDETIRLWDTSTGENLVTIDTEPAMSVAFSPDGRLLAAVGMDPRTRTSTTRVWNVGTRELLFARDGPDGLRLAIAFTRDGRGLVTAGPAGSVEVLDIKSWQVIASLDGLVDQALSIAISPDGKTLAIGGSDQDGGGIVLIWDLNAQRLRESHFTRPGVINALAFAPDSRSFAAADSDKAITIWDVGSTRVQRTLRGHTEEVTSLSFSPTAPLLASGSIDKRVKLWDLKAPEMPLTVSGRSMALSPDGQIIATGSSDGTITMFDTTTGKPRSTLMGHSYAIHSLEFSGDGTRLASLAGSVGEQWHAHGLSLDPSTIETELFVWDLASRERICTVGDTSMAAAFSPKGTTLASAELNHEGTAHIALRALEDCAIYARLPFSPGRRPARYWEDWMLAFSPDGTFLAITYGGETATVWRLASPDEGTKTSGGQRWVTGVAFSPNSRVLATGGSDHVDLWVVGTWELLQRLEGLPVGGVPYVSFAPDGKTLATGAWNGGVKLWDVPTGQLRATFKAQNDRITSVGFSSDGRTLAAASHDGIVKLWRAGRRDPLGMGEPPTP